MIQGMLWIIGIYGTSMILVHIAHLWKHRRHLPQDRTYLDRTTHQGHGASKPFRNTSERLPNKQKPVHSNSYKTHEAHESDPVLQTHLEEVTLNTKNSYAAQQPLHIQQYVLVSNDNQLQIEWYIRSILFFSWVKGKSIHITVVDEESTDDTLKIIEKLALHYSVDISVLNATRDYRAYMELLTEGNAVIFTLNKCEDHRSIPLFQ
jgi:hypothetical protein